MLPEILRILSDATKARPFAVASIGVLVLLTVLAALPVDPQGPLDARTFEQAPGVRLEYPAGGALFEPLAAPGWVVAGAPDYRVAGIAIAFWIPAIACVLAFFWGSRRLGSIRAGARKALVATSCSIGILLLLAAFSLLVRLPGWRLVVEGSDKIVVDLQSHTFGSHDGLVSIEQSLRWHRDRGFHVFAVTEHDAPDKALEAAAFADASPEYPAVIPAVETRLLDGYVLAIGGIKGAPYEMWRLPDEELVKAIRQRGGAVIALGWKLDVEGLRRLAACGVDGFEIANFGHPDLPDDVRKALLEESSRRGLVLVASTDWHGWSGFCRTWTVMHVPGASGMDRKAQTDAVVEALRSRRADNVLPVIAGKLGPPSTLRTIFAPFTETIRYAMELSAERVFAWWMWAIALIGAAEFLRLAKFRPVVVLGAAALFLLGAVVAWRGGELLAHGCSSDAQGKLPLWTGLGGLAIGLVALSVGVYLVSSELRRRKAFLSRPHEG